MFRSVLSGEGIKGCLRLKKLKSDTDLFLVCAEYQVPNPLILSCSKPAAIEPRGERPCSTSHLLVRFEYMKPTTIGVEGKSGQTGDRTWYMQGALPLRYPARLVGGIINSNNWEFWEVATHRAVLVIAFSR